MGRNADIKRFDATRAGQPLELFGTQQTRLPVILELLASPWIVRASELTRQAGSSSVKRVAEDITVEWDAERRCPVTFVRGPKRYRVDAVLHAWVTERAWWDHRRHVSQRFWRVLSRGGVYDLAFDRTSGTWQLVGIQD